MSLVVLPLSNISRLKSPASMIWWVEYFVVRVWIWSWVSGMRGISSICVGIYTFKISIGVRGLLLINMAWR